MHENVGDGCFNRFIAMTIRHESYFISMLNERRTVASPLTSKGASLNCDSANKGNLIKKPKRIDLMCKAWRPILDFRR